MRLPELIALAFLVATAAGFSAHAQTPDLESNPTLMFQFGRALSLGNKQGIGCVCEHITCGGVFATRIVTMTCLNANALDRTGVPTASRTCSDEGVSVPTAARPVFARSRKNITPCASRARCPGVRVRASPGETIESQITAIRAAKPLLSRCQAQSTSYTTSA
jgi:hypothetical protein